MLLPEELTDEQREDYEERAAIMEFDGGLSRSEAEKKAMLRIMDKYFLLTYSLKQVGLFGE